MSNRFDDADRVRIREALVSAGREHFEQYGPSKATIADLEAERRTSLAYFLPYVEAWCGTGAVVGPDPETVANAIHAVSLLTLHVDDLGGGETYRETRDLVVRAIANGLTTRDT